MPRQILKSGDLFAVPLDDGSWCLGQVLDTIPVLMNSFTAAFFDIRGNQKELRARPTELTHELLISRGFVTRDQFSCGNWPRVGSTKISLRRRDLPYKRFLWVKKPIWPRVVGSANIEKFLSAYYGLRPWTEMKDPNYYTALLTEERKKRFVPSNLFRESSDGSAQA